MITGLACPVRLYPICVRLEGLVAVLGLLTLGPRLAGRSVYHRNRRHQMLCVLYPLLYAGSSFLFRLGYLAE